MGSNSGIAWTHHTFNPWWGCTKVSPACENCYAESWDRRWGGNHWGPQADRRFFGDKHWDEPLKWNREAEKAGERRRVFCASMADIFEDRRDLDEPRLRWAKLPTQTQWLDWLVLTKRIMCVEDLMPRDWCAGWPRNVWLGCTVENQACADRRLPILRAIKKSLGIPVTFISVEPMFEQITLSWVPDWVIAGGESGPGCRKSDLEWFRNLRDQVADADSVFFMKQLGGHPNKRDEFESFPIDLKIQRFPEAK